MTAFECSRSVSDDKLGHLVGAKWKRDSLVFGERDDGQICHVEDEDVAVGQACKCTCPGCGIKLVAKKRGTRAKHFAHKANFGSRCEIGQETALHKFAKTLLAREKRLMLPALELSDGEFEWRGSERMWIEFDDALIEHRLGTIIPDVIVRKNDRDLLVEFEVTHKCDDEKIATIHALELATIEIDLSGLSRDTSKAGIERQILEDAPRHWIFNRAFRIGREDLERQRAEAEEMSLRRLVALRDLYAQACEASRKATVPNTVLNVVGIDLASAVGLILPGFGCFNASPKEWQASILNVLVKDFVAGHVTALSARGAYGILQARGFVRREFSLFTRTLEESKYLQSHCSRYAEPIDAIKHWLIFLKAQGVFKSEDTLHGEKWWLSPSVARTSKMAIEYRETKVPLLMSVRAGELRESMHKLIERWLPQMMGQFDFDEWTKVIFLKDYEGNVCCMSDVLAHGNYDYNLLKVRLLERIEDAFKNGSSEASNFGLPFALPARKTQAEIDRERTAPGALKDETVASRLSRLLLYAAERLGDAADEWLNSGHDKFDGLPPMELARWSPTGLASVILELDRYADGLPAKEVRGDDDTPEGVSETTVISNPPSGRRPLLGRDRRRA